MADTVLLRLSGEPAVLAIPDDADWHGLSRNSTLRAPAGGTVSVTLDDVECVPEAGNDGWLIAISAGTLLVDDVRYSVPPGASVTSKLQVGACEVVATWVAGLHRVSALCGGTVAVAVDEVVDETDVTGLTRRRAATGGRISVVDDNGIEVQRAYIEAGAWLFVASGDVCVSGTVLAVESGGIPWRMRPSRPLASTVERLRMLLARPTVGELPGQRSGNLVKLFGDQPDTVWDVAPEAVRAELMEIAKRDHDVEEVYAMGGVLTEEDRRFATLARQRCADRFLRGLSALRGRRRG